MRRNQTEQILEYMKQHGSISALEAMLHLQCMRLGARIHDLKAEGHLIRKEMESHKADDGHTSHYARYFLVK